MITRFISRKNAKIGAVTVLVLMVIGLVLFFKFFHNDKNRDSSQLDRAENNRVCFRDHCFEVELAKSPQEQERGLMNRGYLDKDKGMLFVFEKEGEYNFWMKDTLIPLDIIWINANREVVFISKNTQQCKTENCDVISPDKNAKYVLEINGGTADKIGLKLKDKLSFKIAQ